MFNTSHFYFACVCLRAHRCACMVKAGVRPPALHAAAVADSGERDEAERTHGLSPPQTGVRLQELNRLAVTCGLPDGFYATMNIVVQG